MQDPQLLHVIQTEHDEKKRKRDTRKQILEEFTQKKNFKLTQTMRCNETILVPEMYQVNKHIKSDNLYTQMHALVWFVSFVFLCVCL